MMNRAQTVANTGRRMKKSTNKAGIRLCWKWSGAAHEVEVTTGRIVLAFTLDLLRDGMPSCKKLRPGNNQVISGFEPIENHKIIANSIAKL